MSEKQPLLTARASEEKQPFEVQTLAESDALVIGQMEKDINDAGSVDSVPSRLESAQAAVKALNFQSTAEDHIFAKKELQAANQEAQEATAVPDYSKIGDLITIGKNNNTYHRTKGRFISADNLQSVYDHQDEIRAGLVDRAVLGSETEEKNIDSKTILDEKKTEDSIDNGHLDTEQPALEGESLEEYQIRNGVKPDTTEELDTSGLSETGDGVESPDTPEVSEIDEELDTSGLVEEKEKSSVWKKFKGLYEKAATEFGLTMYGMGKLNNVILPQPSQKMGETIEDFDKRVRRIGFAKVIGLIAVVVAAKYGLDHLNTGHSSGGSLTDHAAQVPGHYSTLDSQDIITQPAAVPEFSTAAHTVTGGEGWYDTFKEMGVTSAQEQANLLQKVGPKLQEMGFAYKMPHGLWGISHTGQLPDGVLEYIKNSR